MIRERLKEQYAILPDVEVLLILQKREDYTEEAIQVAQEELQSRNLNGNISAELESELQQRLLESEALEQQEALMLVLLPFLPMGWMKAKRLKAEGLKRKHRESMAFLKLGLFFYAALLFGLILYFEIDFRLF